MSDEWIMSKEEARSDAEELGVLERAIILKANEHRGTYLRIVTNTEWPTPEAKLAARNLANMQLVNIRQSRLGGKFNDNVVTLTKHGSKVQSVLRIMDEVK
ncbi:hypothetical protein [Qipengyuania sp. ASV99]|uniref:hypothetical protein n=1 Tax=Qipengyuania sp. ASV99 TaxID=3399681 RepID=UPI003A4C7B07